MSALRDLRYKIAGKLIGKSLSYEKWNNGTHFMNNITGLGGNQYVNASIAELYYKCPIIPIVINKEIQAFANYKLKLYNAKGDIISEHASLKLFNSPNQFQTGSQYLSFVLANTLVYGFCFALRVEPFKGKITRLFPLPSQFVNVVFKPSYTYIDATAENYKDLIDRVEFTYNGMTTTLNLDDLYLYTDNTVSLNSIVFPESRIMPLRQIASNLAVNYEARGVLMSNYGALGILSNDGKDEYGTKPLDQKAKEELQSDYKRYGILDSQWRIIITSLALKWQPISLNIADLMLFENEKSDIQTICDAFGYPFELLSKSDKSTYNNQLENKKTLYQDVIIPLAENIIFQHNEAMKLEGVRYALDYSHIPVLQENKKDESDVRQKNVRSLIMQFKNNFIIYDRVMAIMGETELNKMFVGKFWSDLDDAQRLLFDNVSTSALNQVNNQNN